MTTGESADAIPAEAVITRLRTAYAKVHFAMQGLWERSKNLYAAMHGESDRGLPDYEQSPDEIADRVIEIISRRYGRWHVAYRNGDDNPRPNGNGEKRLLTWILGVSSLLLVGGVGGGIAMYGKLSAIEEGQKGHEQRINRLEQDRDRTRAAP